MSIFNHVPQLLFGKAPDTEHTYAASLASANTLPTRDRELSQRGPSPADYHHDDDAGMDIRAIRTDVAFRGLSQLEHALQGNSYRPALQHDYHSEVAGQWSAETLPVHPLAAVSSASLAPTVAVDPPRGSSGLFGRQRPFGIPSMASAETLPVASLPQLSLQQSAQLQSDIISLKSDPFLTQVPDQSRQHTRLPFRAFQERPVVSQSPFDEEMPLVSGKQLGTSRRKMVENNCRLLLVPTSTCMMIQTAISGVALAASFDETGHRDGYEEGHLDPDDQESGCQAAFYWLLVQACCDLLITCLSCLILMVNVRSDPVGFHGCCAAIRLCSLSVGFHILYFSGLKRDLCNPFLIIWSTILTWLGFLMMVSFAFCLLYTLMSGMNDRRQMIIPRSKTPDYRAIPGQLNQS